MSDSRDLSADHPRAVGTVEDSTLRVVATFEGGTTQVIAERELE